MNVWWELLRMGIVILIGAVIVFFIQPLFYESGWWPFILTDVNPSNWVNNEYTWGAGIVFGLSSLLAIIWYIIGSTAKITGSWDVSTKRLLWFIFLIISVAVAGISVWLSCKFFSGASQDALYTLSVLFLFDAIWLYWLTTAISSPQNSDLEYIPPFADFLRPLITGDR